MQKKMKTRILSSELPQHIGKHATVSGWLHVSRIKGNNLAFLILRDRRGLMQIVLEDPKEIQKLDGMLLGTVIKATGNIVKVPKGKFSAEISNGSIEIIQPVTEPSPIDISKSDIKADFDTIHDNKVVYLRHPQQMKRFKIAHFFEKYVRDFFDNNDFTQINTPKIIGFPTEGGAEVFNFQYFDREAYLAQSPQFYKQIMCGVFERVYEIGRAYRAEKSSTSRHTTEILMLDMEMAFIESFDDVLDMTTNFFRSVIDKLRDHHKELLKSVHATQPALPEVFPRISVRDIHELFFQETGQDHRKEEDLIPQEEKFICEYFQQKENSDVVLVDGFPWSDAKFYHKQHSKDPSLADRADLLFRGVEVATITRRETDYKTIIKQIKEQGYDPDNPGLKHFLDAFKYGMPPQGGFGFGIARCIEKLLGLQNIKEAELFPRDIRRLDP